MYIVLGLVCTAMYMRSDRICQRLSKFHTHHVLIGCAGFTVGYRVSLQYVNCTGLFGFKNPNKHRFATREQYHIY